jgi:hypothetical protein
MESSCRLLDHYLPPGEGFVLESLVASTYQVDFEFFEEELLAAALGIRSSISRLKAFRSELERKLQKTEVSVLYDLGGCDRLVRLSPRIDAIPVASRKLHSKISLLMWVREDRTGSAPADRRMRLIVGSANLTRQGFRRNYECVVSVDYGGKTAPPRALLTTAIDFVQLIAADSHVPQLSRQLAAFAAQAALLPPDIGGPDDAVALVAANDVIPAIRDSWAVVSNKAPQTVTVVSPFWTEGSTAPEALASLFQQLGSPADLELVCCSERSPDGKTWLPVFDSSLAVALKNQIKSRLYLRPALPDAGLQPSAQAASDLGDETEEKEFANRLDATNRNSAEVQRSLHAKMILVDGTAGSVLYAGSSNCTRRGLGLGGLSNFEAGFVYRLTPRQRKRVSDLLSFAGPPTEVGSDSLPSTVQPASEEERVVPRFLSEVVASGTVVTIHFREAIPPDLVVLMPIPTRPDETEYWLIYRADAHSQLSAEGFWVDLSVCPRCDEHLNPLSANSSDRPILPHVFVEVRWEGHSTAFPVRFDEKARLPLILIGRKPTEAELIEYFLYGKEPECWNEETGLTGNQAYGPTTDAPVDTSQILAYFIRRFVQAIPGIEAEIQRAGYSRASLDSALRGPTSPLELAERAFASLAQRSVRSEPAKTPTAVGFQVTEILAALLRCRSTVTDPALQECFHSVIASCQGMLDTLVSEHAELREDGFRLYQETILAEPQ